VALDGNVDDATRTSIRNLAVSSIGYDANRGDTINVEGLPFDTTAQDNAKKDMDAMNKAEQLAKRNRLIAIIGGLAAVAVAAIVGVILWRRKKREEEEDLFDEEMEEPQPINEAAEDETQVKEKPKFKPVELETENEDVHLENEIKKYAKDKPDQVADIIKSWLAEDER
jgi:flagellar M-ring protein FliF